MIFYTNRLITSGAAACARGPFIFIRPQYHGDAGLLAHEKEHIDALVTCIGGALMLGWLHLAPLITGIF